MSEVNFKRLTISQWQQFENVDIEIHPNLTVLTGANGSGKTTLLSHILSKHCGWNVNSLSTPKKNKKDGIIRFLTRFFNGEDKSDNNVIGELLYADNLKTTLTIPNSDNAQYNITLDNQQTVPSIFIPSHRATFRYQTISSIPFGKKNKKAAYDESSNAAKQQYLGQPSNSSPSFIMKNTLIGWAIQGYGIRSDQKEIMPSDPEQIGFFEGFKDVLRKVLPPTLGFEDFEIRQKEIVFVCNGGNDEFIFEQASGGISALIDIAWQIFMFSTQDNANFTVIIDEVENHLHPSMQRRILPDLLRAFPEVQFIVSTHSPLIVGSVKDSNTYVLKYNENRKIISEKLDLVNKAKSATQILNDVLGVPFTMPIWAEEELEKVIKKYSKTNLDNNIFPQMKADLKTIGLEDLLPEAIDNIIQDLNDKNN